MEYNNDIKNRFLKNAESEEIVDNSIAKTDTKDNEIINIDIEKLVAFRKKQPFSMYDENKKNETKESIRKNGVLVPIIIRKIEGNKYEIISGHNRVECSKELGIKTIPAQIIDCNDEKAILIMIDTNLCNREKILPVEKGYAYKMKIDILKNDANASNINEYSNNSPLETEESKAQIYRYIRLTELIKSLQEKVNKDEIPLRAGVELSYLSKEEQEIVNQALDIEQVKISLVQAQRIRMKRNNITYELVLKILKNEKIKKEKFTGRLEKRAFKIYKDKFNSDKEFTDLIIQLLDDYFGDFAS